MRLLSSVLVSGPNFVVHSVALVAIIIKTTWFYDKFGVTLSGGLHSAATSHNDPQLHTIVYLQVAIISQALIFVTRSHGFFFMERPSFALMGAFCVAQLISSIIAAYGNWGFTKIEAISGGWIGIVWVWVSRLRLQRLRDSVCSLLAIGHRLVLPPRPH